MGTAKKYDSKRRVLLRGERQRADGTYEFRVMRNGKTHSLYSASLPELRAKEKEFEKLLDAGANIEKQKCTVNSFADALLDAKKKTVARTTFCTMQIMYDKHVRNDFGEQRITTVKRSRIKSFYLSLIKDKGLSVSTVQRLDGILAQVFEMAFDDDVIFKNPCRRVVSEIKKEMHVTPQKVIAPMPEQVERMIQFIKENPFFTETIKNLVIVLFGTGLRVGEATALTWDCVDFRNNEIKVCRAIGYVRENGHAKQIIKTPKTAAGTRTIPMMRAVRQALLAEKERQFSGIGQQPTLDGISGFCFVTNRGTIFTREGVYAQVKRMQRAYNEQAADAEKMPEFSTHAIRHSFATALCQTTDDLKAIQEIMGHSSIQLTMNVYADATNEAKTASLSAFEAKYGMG